MKILAKAKPNQMYENIISISDLVLEARLVNENIVYYETHTRNYNWVVCISEPLVKSLFINDVGIKQRPFLERENKEFYAILHRNKNRYKEQFLKLKNEHRKTIHRKHPENLPQDDIKVRKIKFRRKQ